MAHDAKQLAYHELKQAATLSNSDHDLRSDILFAIQLHVFPHVFQYLNSCTSAACSYTYSQ